MPGASAPRRSLPRRTHEHHPAADSAQPRSADRGRRRTLLGNRPRAVRRSRNAGPTAARRRSARAAAVTGEVLTLGAALLLGLAASGHCLVMCGGISAALGAVTARHADGRPRRDLLVGYQLGRVTSYTLA